MSKFTNIAIAAGLSSAALMGGAASAFAGDYYQGVDPNPTYIHGTRAYDGQNTGAAIHDNDYTGSISDTGPTAAVSSGTGYIAGKPATPPSRGDYYVGGIRN